MYAEEFVDLLDGQKNWSSGQWKCKCPAHDDRVASLVVCDAEDKILLYCHAGCDWKEILDAVKLKPKNLYHDDSEYSEMRIYDAVGYTSRQPAEQPEAIYDYHNADGTIAYQVVRFPNKRFRQRRLADSGWVWNMDGVKRIPYNLPQLVDEYDPEFPVVIVEGEKDVDTLKELDYIATCFVGGANKGKFLASYVKYFKDLDVMIVPDQDDPGIAYAEEIADALTGVAASVTIAEPTKGKDITEHLENGGTLDELKERRI
jgi:5S rRNA maturation endonuclease (ribonuclease M5)